MSLRPIFIGGCQRSGTTFLGSLLGAAPGAITVPESSFRIPWARASNPEEALRRMRKHKSYENWRPAVEGEALPVFGDARELMELLVERYAEAHGTENPQVWIDHTPQNVRYATLAAEQFPDARFVHIVRDGRAVAASIMPLTWGPNTIVEAANLWINRVAHGVALETSALAERTVRVRYEDLLTAPEPTLQRLCGFCEIEFTPEMLTGGKFDVPKSTQHQHALVGKAPEAARAKAWESQLSAREIEIFESKAGELLRLLGYEPRFGFAARGPSKRESLRMAATETLRQRIVNPVRKRE
ncbi:sulfotransferase [bacterium]|nr:MAG: sulfotransferase [bacterium]